MFRAPEGIDNAYYTLRSALQEQIPGSPNTPCRRGNGTCCTKEVGVTKGDALFLMQGIAMKAIPKSLVLEALTRSKKHKDRDRCLFLDDKNLCTIYPWRPLQCMAWGKGGHIRSETQRQDYIEQYSQTGQAPNLKQSEIVSFACNRCGPQLLRQPDTEYPFEEIMRRSAAIDYIEPRQVGNLIDVVKNIASSLWGKKV